MARTWTTTAPTALVNPDGDWYWYKHGDSMTVVRVVRVDGELLIWDEREYEGVPVGLYSHQQWLGPITPEDVARADAQLALADRLEADVEGAIKRAFRPGDLDPGWIHKQACRAAQEHADAAVGRKLREISEALGSEALEVKMRHGEFGYIYTLGAGLRPVSGPGALDRAHAEVCGEWTTRTPAVDSLNARRAIDAQAGEPAPAKPNFTCATCSARVTTGFSDGKSDFLCCRCWDACGRPSEFSLLACEAVMPPPAKPDYASMSDNTIAEMAGLYSSDYHTVEIDDPSTRAALIAFLEQRPTKPAR